VKLRRSETHDPAEPSLDDRDREIAELDERIGRDEAELREVRGFLDRTDHAVGDLDRVDEFREREARLVQRLEDAKRVRDRRVNERERAFLEFKLSLLDPLRVRILEGEERIAELEAELAATRRAVTEGRQTLEDAEDDLRHPESERDDSGPVRWWVEQVRQGMFPVMGAQWNQLPRSMQRKIRARLVALNEALPAALEAQHANARRSWQEAGITPTFDVATGRAEPVTVPPLGNVPTAAPYVKLR